MSYQSINPASLATQYATVEYQSHFDHVNKKMAVVDQQIAGWAALNTLMTTMSTAAKTMSTADSKVTGTLSDDTIGSVAVGEDAVEGSYEIYVEQVAKAQQTAFSFDTAGKGKDYELPTSGSFDITSSDGTVTTFDMAEIAGRNGGKVTLETMAKEVNSQSATTGVQVDLIQQSSDGQMSLVFKSTETGADNAFTIGNFTNGLDFGAAQEVSRAQDAKIRYGGQNGVLMTSSSNKIEIAPGVTVDLKPSAKRGDSFTVDVARDAEAITTDANAFITAYNEFIAGANALVAKDGDLAGNSTARSLISGMKNILRVDVNGTTLSSIGINVERDGTLSLDTEKFDAALKNDPKAVSDVMAQVGKDMESYITDVTGETGSISAAETKLEQNKADLQKQLDDLTARQERTFNAYLKEFTALDMTMREMQSTMGLFM